MSKLDKFKLYYEVQHTIKEIKMDLKKKAKTKKTPKRLKAIEEERS